MIFREASVAQFAAFQILHILKRYDAVRIISYSFTWLFKHFDLLSGLFFFPFLCLFYLFSFTDEAPRLW